MRRAMMAVTMSGVPIGRPERDGGPGRRFPAVALISSTQTTPKPYPSRNQGPKPEARGTRYPVPSSGDSSRNVLAGLGESHDSFVSHGRRLSLFPYWCS